MGKKKPAGHYCRICGRRRANEKFGGRGHALHICKDCQRELKREARQKSKAEETDAVVLEPEEDLMDMDEDDLELMLDQPLTTQPKAKKASPMTNWMPRSSSCYRHSIAIQG
jgi:ribosome-binding protein aMBF1 (putative translation factor)